MIRFLPWIQINPLSCPKKFSGTPVKVFMGKINPNVHCSMIEKPNKAGGKTVVYMRGRGVKFGIACDHALSLYLFNLFSEGGHDTILSQITCKKATIWTFFWLDRKQWGWFALFRLAKMPPSIKCWFQSAFLDFKRDFRAKIWFPSGKCWLANKMTVQADVRLCNLGSGWRLVKWMYQALFFSLSSQGNKK